MKLITPLGATSQIWQVFVMDSSSSTGAGLTGLVFNSGSLTAYYHRDTDTTATAISLVTMTVGTFTSSGFKEIDATNMPGWYQFCPPNAALASGAKNCGFHLKGATNMAPLPIECQLVAFDPNDAVRLGLTALPNAAAGASTGLPLSVDSSGRVDVLKINGTSQTARDIGANVLLSAGTGTGQLDFTSGVVKANATQLLGTAWLTPGVAGTPDVNAKLIGGTSQTGRDIGASVLLSSGTGTGQVVLSSGLVAVTSSIKKNSASRITFVMTDSTTHAPKTGVTVTAQRSLDGGALAGCANSVSEIGSGLYTLVLAAADTNADELCYRFTGTSSDDLIIERVTQP